MRNVLVSDVRRQFMCVTHHTACASLPLHAASTNSRQHEAEMRAAAAEQFHASHAKASHLRQGLWVQARSARRAQGMRVPD